MTTTKRAAKKKQPLPAGLVEDDSPPISGVTKELAEAVAKEGEIALPEALDDLGLVDIEIKEPGVAEPRKISPAYRKKLQSIGITEPMGLAVANPEDLMNYLGLARDVASSMIESAQRLLADKKIIDKGILTAKEIEARRARVKFITTGAKALDEILKGGIETSAVTEVYAEFGAGKSQMCFSVAVNAQLPADKGGLGQGAGCIWIDTERTFRPERIKEIAAFKGMDPEAVIDKMVVAQIQNAAHLEMFIKELVRLIRQYNAKVVVVDSIIALHRAEFAGRGTLYDKQHKIHVIMNQLVKLADFFNIAILITNQVSASPDNVYGSDPMKPTGGNIVAHMSTYRLSMRKGGGGTRIVRIVDSPYHPYTDCRVMIGKVGVMDVVEKEEK